MNGRWSPAAWSRRPARIVAAIGLVAGLAFSLLAPPFAGYDESTHFVRAYQVAHGDLVATHRGHELGGSMPAQLSAEIGRLLTGGLYARHDRTAFLDRLGDRPPGGRNVFIDFRSGAVYSPIPYAPAALFMAVGRSVGASTLALLYLGRIGSLLATIGLLVLAVRRMPTRAWMLAAVALFPATVFQAAMISADGITIALALLAVALALDVAATPRGAVTRGRLIEIALTTIALGLAKPPYILFALAFLIPMRRHRGMVARALAASIGAGFVATAAWSAYASSVFVPPKIPPGYAGPLTKYTVYTHVDQHRQERFVLHNPVNFLSVIGRTLTKYGSDLVRETVAQVPLWSVPLFIVVAGFAIVAVGASIADTRATAVLGRQSRALLLGIALATFVALMLLAYAGWNAVGSPRIEAFQGRYLIPLVPLALLALPERTAPGVNSWTRNAALIVTVASSLLLAIVWFGLRSHFY
jgi:uncharacterized membrane protein